MYLTAFILLLYSVCRAWNQDSTTDISIYGNLPSPSLPQFLADGPMKNGFPWGNIDPSRGSPPNTGKVRSYDWNISRGYRSLDGYNKSVILINDQFPGPLVEANWGDTIRVKVTNNIDDGQEEGTTIHWHGLLQKETPWYDGVPSVSQCPIAPKGSFTYSFQADQYGTSWYHSHYSAQYTDGLHGPLIIYGPSHVKYDIDVGPVMLSDYFHETYFQQLQLLFEKPPIFAGTSNNLINGRGLSDCSNQTGECHGSENIARFNFTTGAVHRLRLINVGQAGNQKFSIDGHELTVIANDFVPLRPYKTKVVTLGIGQRTDILVKATAKNDSAIWMRSDLDVDCLNATFVNTHAMAAIYYPAAEQTSSPKTKAYTWKSNHCRNDPLELTVPYYLSAPPPNPATQRAVEITAGLNATGHLVFFVDNSSFRGNYNNPLLLLANLGNTSYPDSPEWNVYDFGGNSSIRLLIKNSFEMQHPLHLHGHNFWVLAEGTGEWDGSTVHKENPQRRDTQILAPGTPEVPSFVVLEWLADNPGVWPLHCHATIHVSAGLSLNIMENPEQIRKRNLPMVMAQTCRDWAAFSGTKVVNQIDSGL